MRAARFPALALAVATGLALAQLPPKHSGFADMTPALQAMQRDDAQNPGMLWVAEGEAQWRHAPGERERSCADCHGDAASTMRGVAARYPAFDEGRGRPVTLSERIGACRERHQHRNAPAPGSDATLALEAYVAFQSRGLPLAPPADPRLDAFRARGEALYRQRMGQLDLACSHCHDDLAGRRLGSATIPQGHPTGYPIYRLEWQGMGTLARRLRGCMAGVRAEPFAYGSDELVALEVFLAARAAGLPLESPAVRP